MLDRFRDWLTGHPLRTVAWGWIMVLMIVSFLGLFVTRAWSETPVAIWRAPTKNCDGTVVPVTGPTAIARVRLEWSACPTGAMPPPEGTITLSAPDAGNSLATACFQAFATNAEGQESGPSTVKCVSVTVPVDPCLPAPGLKTTLATVYEIYAFNGQTYLGASIGTAPIGTPCRAQSYTINGIVYHEVPLGSVTLKRQPKSAVVTRCAQV